MNVEKSTNAESLRHWWTPQRHAVKSLLLLVLWSVWWGGLTFYAVVVVPIGTEVLGSVEQGFVTQQVTHWHNALTGLMSLTLLVRAYLDRSRTLWIIAATLTAISIALVIWHARLTGMMNFEHQTVPGGFYGEHAVYLWMTAAEWFLGMVIPMWLLPVDAPASQQDETG
ncbi:MAG: hypothetical protein JWN70_1207 [Planctomycetaceae bacterium]|nr:hypothetical protein [Planctomycetaceae bacterium]